MTQWETLDWVQEVQKRGAGEIVLNMMNQDGVRNGYDLEQLKKVRAVCHVPLIASGGAGTMEHFWKPSAMRTLTVRWRRPCSTNRLSILVS